MKRNLSLILIVGLTACSTTLGLAQSVVGQIHLGTNASNLAVNPVTDSVYVTNSNQGSVSVIDGHTGSVVGTISTGQPLVQAVSVNWKTDRVYVTSDNFSTGNAYVHVINGRTNQLLDSIFVSNGSFLGLPAIAVNPFTNRIYVTDTNNGAIAVIDGAKDQVITSIPVAFEPLSVTVNPLTNRIYTDTNSPIGKAFVIDGRTNEVVKTIAIGGFPGQLVADVTNDRIFIGTSGSSFPTPTSGGIYVVDGKTNKVVAVITDFIPPGPFDVDPFTNRLWITATGTINFLNASTNSFRSSLNVGGTLQAIAVDPLRNTAYVVVAIGVIDVVKGR